MLADPRGAKFGAMPVLVELGVTQMVILRAPGGVSVSMATAVGEAASQHTCFVVVSLIPATSTNGFENGLRLALVYGVLWHLRQTLKEM